MTVLGRDTSERLVDCAAVRGFVERVCFKTGPPGLVGTELEWLVAFEEGELLAQHSTLMSPLVWDLAHIGNNEEQWLLREALALDPDRELLDAGFVSGMVLQHEHQHDETMLATHQLRRGDPVLPATDRLPAPTVLVRSAEVTVAAGPFTMGTSTDSWALDNDRPAHRVDLASYALDTVPVSNAAYRAFVEAGGYDDEWLWSPGGWHWRCEPGKRAPAFWFGEGGSWMRRRFARVEPLPDDEPVQHVCWFEAEWEKAASWHAATGTKCRYPWGEDEPTDEHANLGQSRYHPVASGSFPEGASPSGALQMVGDEWEWTSSDFTGYPGFRSFPYREYSEVFFDQGYKVLRGGCWATDPLACRTTFRNWDHPIRRQIFAGFRTARDV